MEKNDYTESLTLYGDYYRENKDILLRVLNILKNDNYLILWGAGLKGKAFLQVIDNKCEYIDCIVDMDKKKQGEKLLTGHEVCGIEKVNEKSIILVANVKYYVSICASLINHEYDLRKLRLFLMDDYIKGDIKFESIEDNTVWLRRRYYD